jgi:AcrR family transcriptional regulator
MYKKRAVIRKPNGHSPMRAEWEETVDEQTYQDGAAREERRSRRTPEGRAESRRDRRIQKKKEAILSAATRVFAQDGFASATTKDIADAADMGESTLYDYFDSKRDILLAIFYQNHAIFDAMFQEAGTLRNRAALIDLADRCLEFSLSRMLFVRTLVFEAWVDDNVLNDHVWPRLRHIFDTVENFIAAQIQAKTLRPVDPGLAARFTLGMFFSAVLPVLRGVEPPPSPEQRHALAEAMVSMLLDGLSVRKAE